MVDNLLDEVKDPTSYLNELVGEGKKFKDLEALAYGKHQSDVYVKTLERQLDQLKSDYSEARNELQSRAKFEELADRLSRSREPAYESKPENNKPEIDINQLQTIVATQIKETEMLRKQQENLQMVKSKLSETFGENLENKLKEVGLDGESAAQMAKLNPQLVLRAFGIGEVPKQPGFQPPPHNTGFNKTPEQKRTWSYYQNLFADPKKAHLKFDRTTNVQMQKDYIALGSEFEDGDFHRFG